MDHPQVVVDVGEAQKHVDCDENHLCVGDRACVGAARIVGLVRRVALNVADVAQLHDDVEAAVGRVFRHAVATGNEVRVAPREAVVLVDDFLLGLCVRDELGQDLLDGHGGADDRTGGCYFVVRAAADNAERTVPQFLPGGQLVHVDGEGGGSFSFRLQLFKLDCFDVAY